MTVAVARFATEHDHLLVDGYARFCHRADFPDRALRDRLRLARLFLAEHPDLKEWMTRPTRTKLADLRRIQAWPLLSWAGLSGRVHVDLDLLAAKDLGGMSATARQLWPEQFECLWATARRLEWSYYWGRSVIDQFVPAVIAWSQTPIASINAETLAGFATALEEVTSASATTLKQWRGRLFGLRQLLFECGQLPQPPQRGPVGGSTEQRLAAVPAPGIRRAMTRYVAARAAVLSRSSVNGLVNDLILFGEFLDGQFPDITSLTQLERRHIEAFLGWNCTRTWRGRVARDQRVSASAVHGTVLTVRNFLDDITLWGWADRPPRRLVFASDVPRLPRPLPRALAPDTDTALITAVGNLEDLFARSAILLLRRTGLRLGECLDLELSCVIDYGPTGTWLRVPLGKLGTERAVPLDTATVAALDAWAQHRGPQRSHPHPRTGKPTDFLFAEHGRRLSAWRIREGLRAAATAAGLAVPGGQTLAVTPHQLRHTYATELANAGMSLQALMAILGHVTPEMTLRYATLASPTLRMAYDQAIGKVRKALPIAPVDQPIVPAKIDWIASEFLKTRVAHGYCSRHLAAGACPYANICETCDNFVPAPEHLPLMRDQLSDIRQLRADAERRRWTDEIKRHDRVINALEHHCGRLENAPTTTTSP
jgi:site-specific recombinase XerD